MKKKTTVQEYENQLADKFMPAKEVKEGGELFTGGEWEILANDFGTQRIGVKKEYPKYINIASTFNDTTKEETSANAALIAQSKNMYYCLKDFMDIVKGISIVPVGSQLTVTIPASLFENASIVLQKATPKK